MIVSIHVPKCAGTSFKRVLTEICGARIWYNYGTIFSRDQARAELVPPGTNFIHGHFLADAFDDLFPGRRLVTWVRHPVERLVSNYHHFLRSPDMRDDCCRALHERQLSLRQFADLEWMRNEACRYLANKPVEDFEFIGITEKFGASIQHFCRAFGFRNVLRVPRENPNPDRVGELYPLSPDDRAYILERNAADLDWYNRASQRLADAGTGDSPRVA
ncbi:MAG TPA: sulfotransferase family 2 domain-containing protein [Opitutaceae bacterium]|nr:sulfotransferase family 2 domain-containing protein [Opitutaceae bacterium]